MSNVKTSVSQSTFHVSEHEKTMQVRALLLMGYGSRVISIETGWSQKRVRKIRSILKQNDELSEFVDAAVAIRPMSSRTLINSLDQQRQASLLMVIYSRVHPQYKQMIDPIKLARAYGMYAAAVQAHSQGCPFEVDMTINDAWALAAELRSNEGELVHCPSCHTLNAAQQPTPKHH